ncbi:MAG: hypothetical protein IE885_04055 [Campylobacterales bacterium]|nr:hypothetical protein [Campylobacterales bacterium]
MRQLMSVIALIVALNGCQDAKEKQAEHDAEVAQEAREQLLKELKEKELEEQKAQEEAQKNSKLSKIGITADQGVITIDTNKTQGFFKHIGKQIDTKMKEINEDLEDGIFRHEEAGIEFNNTHINIDLNQTKSFLDEWSRRMEGFVREFDEMAKELEEKTDNPPDQSDE